jgi:hypothetical protein
MESNHHFYERSAISNWTLDYCKTNIRQLDLQKRANVVGNYNFHGLEDRKMLLSSLVIRVFKCDNLWRADCSNPWDEL